MSVTDQLSGGANAWSKTQTENQVVQTALKEAHELLHPICSRTFFRVPDKSAKLFFTKTVVNADFLFFFQTQSIVRVFAAFVAVFSGRVRTSFERARFAETGKFR